MTQEPNNDPARKMRNLLGGEKASPVGRLPKKEGSAAAFLPKQDAAKKNLQTANLPASKPVAPNQTQPKPASVKAGKSPLKDMKFGPPFWTIASIISLTVNVVLLIIMLGVLINLRQLNMGSMLGLGNNLLGGLYTNFEKMDRAHITTTIPVQTTIPVVFDLPLNQATNVVLSQDVTIENARVTVNTGGLNITNALTRIVLPQGTTLPVLLNLTVPVDTTVPVVLDVNVDIPLSQTQLHEPFSGLQDVVRPFYCIISPNAVNLDNQPVCP
jgi:hypothetical protein